eukprot:2309597-Amphidinium_carterae.1
MFNSQQHQYVKVTSEYANFADVSWESVFEHLWALADRAELLLTFVEREKGSRYGGVQFEESHS